MSKPQPGQVPEQGAAGFSGEFVHQALDVFERNALWLLISIIHYGWRAHADMANLLVRQRPSDDASDEEWHQYQHRALAALEEVFLLVDQLYRLIHAVRSHLAGEDFLTAYIQEVSSLHAAYTELVKMTSDEWGDLLPLPEPGALVKCLGDLGAPDAYAREVLELAESLHGLCVTNMREIAIFFERAPSSVPGKTNCSLRDMNNMYRHGTRVLYGDCSPVVIGLVPSNPEERAAMLLPLGEVGPEAWDETVDILTEAPDETGRAFTVKSRYSEQWCRSLVAAAANLGILMRRLAAGFLRTQVDGQPSCAALLPVAWTPLDADGTVPDSPEDDCV